MATKNVRAKFSATWAASGLLQQPRKAVVREKLTDLAKRGVASSKARVGDMAEDLLQGVKVIKPGEPGFDEAKAAEAKRKADQWEWDLALANELDKAYTAVSDEAKKVGKAVGDAIDTTTLLLVAGALLLFAWKKK